MKKYKIDINFYKQEVEAENDEEALAKVQSLIANKGYSIGITEEGETTKQKGI